MRSREQDRERKRRERLADIEKYRKRSRDWARNNRDIVNAIIQRRRDKEKATVYNHYGRKCKCCGETEELFLTIDHKDGHGLPWRMRRRKSCRQFAQIIKQKFPKSIQILCFNCNSGRARNKGICPHKRRK